MPVMGVTPATRLTTAETPLFFDVLETKFTPSSFAAPMRIFIISSAFNYRFVP